MSTDGELPGEMQILRVMAAAIDDDGYGFSPAELQSRAEVTPVVLVWTVPMLEGIGLMEGIRENGRRRHRLTDEGVQVLRKEVRKISELMEADNG